MLMSCGPLIPNLTWSLTSKVKVMTNHFLGQIGSISVLLFFWPNFSQTSIQIPTHFLNFQYLSILWSSLFVWRSTPLHWLSLINVIKGNWRLTGLMWLICLNFVNKFHIVFLSLDYQGVHILCHNDFPRDETFTLIETEVSAHLLIIYRYTR